MSVSNRSPFSRHGLLLSTSALALLLASGAPAFAADKTIADGVTVGHQALDPDDKLTIEAGGKIVDNMTTIDSASNGNFTIINKGTIEVTGGASIHLDHLDLDNSGTINALTQDGIVVSEIGTLNNAKTGVIFGDDAALHATTIFHLNNDGKLISNQYGIQATSLVDAVNTGTIHGEFIAISVGDIGSLTNSGDITATTNSAISAGGNINSLQNSGKISSGNSAAIVVGGNLGSITNTSAGQIVSVTGNAIAAHAIGSVSNSGKITGGTGYGISSATSIGVLDNSETGTIEGKQSGVFASQDIDALNNSGTITGDTDHGVRVVGNLKNLTNSGTITSKTFDGVNGFTIGALTNSGTIEGGEHGVYGADIGTVFNSKTITGFGGDGVRSGGVMKSLTNTGDITGSLAGVNSDSIDALTNSGSITGKTMEGVHASTIGDVVNDGSIAGSNAGIKSDTTINSLVNAAKGTISGDQAIFAQTSIGSVHNAGAINAKYFGVLAATGFLGQLTNTGTISGGQGGIGADSLGALVNTGRISGVQEGIASIHGIASLANSGSITASDPIGVGIFASSGDIGDVVNSGTIAGGIGLFAVSGNLGNLRNSGAITGGIGGIALGNGSIFSMENSGTIRGANVGGSPGASFGVQADAIFALTNSGMIGAYDPAGVAIKEKDPSLNSNTLLTLNAGSVLIGHVDIHGGTNTLAVGNGLNLALTFDTSVPELIQTSGAPYVVVGNTVYVADLGAFAAAGVATSNLTGAVGDAASAALEKGFDEKGADGSGHYWLQAIGGYDYQSGRDGAASAHDRFGGFVVGGDFGANADQRLGFFVGGARGVVESRDLANNADSFYAGLYGASQFEDFSIEGALTGGYTNSNIDRTVANNTVATGLQVVNSDQNAFFIAPSITFTKPWVTQDLTLKTSLTLNYTGLFSGGFTESVPGGASVGRSSIHVFEAEGLLRLPFQTVTESGMLSGDIHAGLEGRAIVNPALSGSLAGTPVSFTTADTRATLGIVAGGAVEFKLDSGVKLFGGSDVALRSDQSLSLGANAGIKGEF